MRCTPSDAVISRADPARVDAVREPGRRADRARPRPVAGPPAAAPGECPTESAARRDGTWQADPQARCLTLSTRPRGKLCAELARRPARRVPSGGRLYFVGQPARSIYLVRSGLVATSLITPAGDEIILQLHRPGDIVGELCFCTGERREQAVALVPSEVVEVLLDDLRGHLRRSPESALDLVVALSEHLAEAQGRLQSLASESALERLARTLLMLADTLGEAAPEGCRIAYYVRQEELAQMVVARREVVSGLLNRLRERGLIRYSRKGPISVQRDALQSYVAALWREAGK